MDAMVYAVIFFLIAYAAMCIVVVRENENVVVVRLGRPKRCVASGVAFLLWPIDKSIKFTTNIIDIDLGEATIITKDKKAKGKKDVMSARVSFKAFFYFSWPNASDMDDDTGEPCLFKAVRKVDNPQDKIALKNFFQEPILDAIRSVGGRHSWKEIIRDQHKFSVDVLKALKDEPDRDPFTQICIKEEKLVLTEPKLPEELEKAITAPEVARLNAEAAKEEAVGIKEKMFAEAEGIKAKILAEAEGQAKAREIIFQAIGDKPEDLQKEILLTLREMAKGTSNTVMYQIPAGVSQLLENVFGKQDFSKLISENRKFFYDLIDEYNKKGGNIV